MATRAVDEGWRGSVGRAGRRGGAMLGALAILAATLALAFALASYHLSDPSLNTAAGGPPANALGRPGAWGADLLLTTFGAPAFLLLPPLIVVALRLWRGVAPGRWARALPKTLVAMVLLDLALALVRNGAVSLLPAGLGGVIGIAGADAIGAGLAMIEAPDWAEGVRLGLVGLFGLLGLSMAFWSLGLESEEREALFRRDRAIEDEDVAPPAIVREPRVAPAPRAVVRDADRVPVSRPTIAHPTPAPQYDHLKIGRWSYWYSMTI